MKTTFKSEEPKKLIYREKSNFSCQCFKDDIMSSICQEKRDYSDFEKKFVDTLNDTLRKKLCFTQFSTRMAAWLLLIFFICLHNQLSPIHSITRIKSIDVWKMRFIKQTVKMNGCSFQQVLRQN